ncbi:hypothetical protein Tcan_12066 [Toxocara canis]|uniref:Uncharacterized protein n=1 Tax=Toxocara canis TaxID=6265 RepID=A0A0B2UPA3_TOXCA|nr:hypothetical protein Tcan_12066 [Toxocara canis]
MPGGQPASDPSGKHRETEPRCYWLLFLTEWKTARIATDYNADKSDLFLCEFYVVTPTSLPDVKIWFWQRNYSAR